MLLYILILINDSLASIQSIFWFLIIVFGIDFFSQKISFDSNFFLPNITSFQMSSFEEAVYSSLLATLLISIAPIFILLALPLCIRSRTSSNGPLISGSLLKILVSFAVGGKSCQSSMQTKYFWSYTLRERPFTHSININVVEHFVCDD